MTIFMLYFCTSSFTDNVLKLKDGNDNSKLAVGSFRFDAPLFLLLEDFLYLFGMRRMIVFAARQTNDLPTRHQTSRTTSFFLLLSVKCPMLVENFRTLQSNLSTSNSYDTASIACCHASYDNCIGIH